MSDETEYRVLLSGQLLRWVVCDDGVTRPNRKKCRRLGLLLTKRQRRKTRFGRCVWASRIFDTTDPEKS